MILVIGEILFDIFPDYKRLGGAPFNFAYHLKKLGKPVRFVSRVGRDQDGEKLLEHVVTAGFEAIDIQIDPKKPSGKVIVELDKNKVPQFQIITGVSYDEIQSDPILSILRNNHVDLIYVGTLIQRTQQGHRTIRQVLENKSPETKCFYDVNLRPDCYSKDIILDTLAHTDILKLNSEELDIIRKMLNKREDDNSFVSSLIKMYGLELVAVTKGSKGSSVYTETLNYDMALSPVDGIMDTVGAGDAFASMFALGYLRNWNLKTLLTRASNLASRICQIKGAIPTSISFYRTPFD